MLQKIIYNFLIAIEAMSHNKLRTFLTSLGIIFGVASVIAMLAIGRGAQQEILEQLKLLGANNIIIKPIVEQNEGEVTEEFEKTARKKRFSPGLTLLDAMSIEEMIPYVRFVSPEIIVETTTIRAGLRRTIKLVGINSNYFSTSEFELAGGNYFSEHQLKISAPVCIIGQGIKTKFFAKEEPLGKKIKCGKLWLTVVGVLKDKKISRKNIQHLGIRDYNMDIYTPISTLLLRYKNRALVTRSAILKASRQRHDDDNDDSSPKKINYHQLDRLIVRVEQTEYISSVSGILSRMLQRRHNDVVDYEIIVPELLLQQEQRTKAIFNIVLGAIASISLIVGGIGIMNIMLASVLERIKEIGIRLSIGATQKDIILQFLSEAVAISVTGGIIGILLGTSMSYGIEKTTGILTLISPVFVIISFAVSISIGLVFGILPAKKAAAQDPVVSLRHE